MKRAGKIFLIMLAVFAGLVFCRNTVIKFVIEHGVKSAAGVSVSIQRMHIGLTHVSVDIRGLKLLNPWGYPERVMMDAPQVAVDMRAGELFKGKVHLASVRLHVNEFVVIKNAKGEVNVNALKPIKEGKKEQQKIASQKSAGKAPQLQIDSLEYSIGKVVYKDYSQGKPPRVQEFPINISRKYTNVTQPAFLVSVIVADVVARTAVARLANVDISGVKTIISDTLKGGAGAAGDIGQEIIDGFREIFN